MKHLNKFKFCKETINAIEIQKSSNSLIGLCDDSGQIRLCDLRQQQHQQQEASLTLKKKLTGHNSNIVSTIKFSTSKCSKSLDLKLATVSLVHNKKSDSYRDFGGAIACVISFLIPLFNHLKKLV